MFKRCFFKETGGEEFVGLEYGHQTVTEASECMNILGQGLLYWDGGSNWV